MPLADVRHPASTGTRVHLTARRPGPFVGYFDQVVASEDSQIEFRFAAGSLSGFDFDVLHTLSTDTQQLAGPSSLHPALRAKNALSLVAQLRRHRIALVQTVMDEASLERPSMAHRILNEATTGWIAPDATIRSPNPRRTTVIPFAHYRERFVGYPRAEVIPGRLFCVHTPDRSELTSHLTGVVRVSKTANLSLRIVGEDAAQLGAAVHRENRRTEGRVSVEAGKISDGALLQEIDRAELVVQPRAERFHDYQIVLLALSRGRPVLVPSTGSMRHLASEVGDRWVHIARGPITAATIDRVLKTLRSTAPALGPDLTERNPRTIGAAYAAFYLSARRTLQ